MKGKRNGRATASSPRVPDLVKDADQAIPESFPVVGIGASAGGLEAFRRLLGALPNDTGMAYVLVQHLHPSHESILTELLSEATQMSVCEITGDVRVEPNRVYVIPPSKGLLFVDGWLKLPPRSPPGATHMPIDAFFQSLAAAQGSRAIGVVLSGMGSDGTLGLRAIEGEGGIAFAQTPASAKSNDMPLSAINGSAVDFVQTPEDIARELGRLGRHPYLAAQKDPRPAADASQQRLEATVPDGEQASLARVLDLMRQAGGTDFRAYKKTTLRRRIARRMAVRNIETLAEYADVLEGNAAEGKTLSEECLVSVTSFFRDNEVFEALTSKVLATLLKAQAPGTPLRVWVPGCATGEEVYSLAMCLLEQTGPLAQHPTFQIFATDLSERALNKARTGRYPLDIVTEVSAQRLQRFFTKEGESYQISKGIRDLCLFARHDLIRDTPYSRIDLISCRNLLIYLESSLQERVFATFHYALRPDGFLLIGPAETVGGSSSLFSVVDEAHRIYSKRTVSGPPRLLLASRATDPSRIVLDQPSRKAVEPLEVPREADRMLLARLNPAGVVVDDALSVVEFRGNTDPYLDHSQGKATLGLERLLRRGLLMEFKQAIAEARLVDGPVRREGLQVRYQGELQSVAFEILPIKGRVAAEHCLLILFEREAPARSEQKVPATSLARKPDTKEREHAKLAQTLTQTTEYMHTLVREHESALEELRTTTEEALSSNEELQSLNEELQTAKEEIQSANEELATLNQELQDRNAQLGRSNESIQRGLDAANALVDTVPRPLLILNGHLRVEKANLAFYETFGTTPALTENHPLAAVGGGQWKAASLSAALREVLERGSSLNELEFEAEFPALGARTVSVSARRLHPESGMPGRIVLTVEDRSELKRVEREREGLLELAAHARDRAEAADHLKDQFVATASHELRGPLTVIASWMNVLLSAGDSPPPVTLAKALAAIGRGVTAQGRLISDLLDQSQLASGKVDLQRKPTDLLAVAEAALVGVRAAALAKELDIQLSGDHATSVVLGDADRLQQVLWNLFLNAVKFTPRGGRIRIAIARLDNHLELAVADNGCGIPAEFLPHVFERFRQADGSSNRTQPGLGLGLTLARELIELHGGTILAESAGTGQGSKFTILLPIPALLLPSAPAESTPASEPPPAQTPPTVPPGPAAMPSNDLLDGTSVLVVDDDPDARDALVNLLERYGARVCPAASVAEAMKALATHLPDVLISDIGMPGADGYDLIRKVRLLPPEAGGRLPSLAVSAYATEDHRKRMLETGFQKHLAKPVAPAELVTEVARLAGRLARIAP